MTATSVVRDARRRSQSWGCTLIAATALSAACGSAREGPEGLDPSTLADNVRADYAVFAHRCSKCHSLARPLDSGIDKDEDWAMYVARMRKQPASGISPDDVAPILRFLHYYAQEQRQRTTPANTATAPSDPAVPTSGSP